MCVCLFFLLKFQILKYMMTITHNSHLSSKYGKLDITNHNMILHNLSSWIHDIIHHSPIMFMS